MSFMTPSAKQDDRLARLETQVSYLAECLGVSSEELAAHSAPPLPDEARRLLADGREVQAIKVYRDSTGASLEAAKRVIAEAAAVARS